MLCLQYTSSFSLLSPRYMGNIIFLLSSHITEERERLSVILYCILFYFLINVSISLRQLMLKIKKIKKKGWCLERKYELL